MKYVDFNLQNKIYKINQANNIKKIRHCLFLILQIIHSLFVKNIPRNIYRFAYVKINNHSILYLL